MSSLRFRSRTARTVGPARATRTLRAERRLIASFTRLLPVLVWAFALSFTTSANGQPASNGSSGLRGYRWDFGRLDDANYDGKPDDWIRATGLGYPSYIKIEIIPHDAAKEAELRALDTALVRYWPKLREKIPSAGPLPPPFIDWFVDRYLAIELDGGQAKIESPIEPTSQMYQYRFSCLVRTKGLKHSSAGAKLVFLDAAGQEISTADTRLVGGTTPWTRLEVDKVQPPANAKSMRVRLYIQGSDDGLQDVRGHIGFDQIHIEPFPQLQISTNDPLGVYWKEQTVIATAKVLGMPVNTSEVVFRLLDHDNKEVLRHAAPVEVPLDRAVEVGPNRIEGDESRASGSVNWKLPSLEPGLYRIASAFANDKSTTLETSTTFVVIEPLNSGVPSGPFGWTFPSGDRIINTRELLAWLPKVGVAWFKYPCWESPDDGAAIEQNAIFLSRLLEAGIQPVGMLSNPPESEYEHYELRGPKDAVAANLFRDPKVWQQRVEPIMSQMTLKIRNWQLGDDHDHSFLGRPRIQESIASIRSGLQGYGQPINVALPWPWLEPTPAAKETSWQALCQSTEVPLAADELDAYLKISENPATRSDAKTWVVLDPLDRERYDRDTRIQDLVLRMATLRGHSTQAAFISDPLDPRRGLLEPDGRPSELLLPWRTTSQLIGNMRRVGAIELRCEASNIVFAGENRALLMVWSPTPKTERMFLGDKAKQVDVWGRVKELPRVKSEGLGRVEAHQFEIGPVPTFLVDVDPVLLAFRMSIAIQQRSLDSVLGQPQPLNILFTNPTRESMAGDLRIRHPETWSTTPPIRSWELAPGGSTAMPISVVLGNSAMIGDYEIAVDFDLQTSPPRTATVYRKIRVGVEGLDVKLTTRVTEADELVVTLEFSNKSAQVQSFDCMLFPPSTRQYQRRFIRANPDETVIREFYWPGGKELVGGRVLLRATQDGGKRVINYDAEIVAQ